MFWSEYKTSIKLSNLKTYVLEIEFMIPLLNLNQLRNLCTTTPNNNTDVTSRVYVVHEFLQSDLHIHIIDPDLHDIYRKHIIITAVIFLVY